MGRYRDKIIYIRVTEEEKNIIIGKMQKIGMTNLSDFARRALLLGNFVRINTDGLNKLSYEVGKVGNNINQIAKHANAAGNIYKNQMDEINKDLDFLVNYVNDIYLKVNKVERGVNGKHKS